MDTLHSPSYRLAWARTPEGVVVLRYHESGDDSAGPADVLASWAAGGAPRDPGSPVLRLLFDLRAVPRDAPGSTVLRFVQGLPDLVRRLPQRRAYLVAGEQQRGLASLIQAHSDPLRFEAGVFTAWREALDWLEPGD